MSTMELADDTIRTATPTFPAEFRAAPVVGAAAVRAFLDACNNAELIGRRGGVYTFRATAANARALARTGYDVWTFKTEKTDDGMSLNVYAARRAADSRVDA